MCTLKNLLSHKESQFVALVAITFAAEVTVAMWWL